MFYFVYIYKNYPNTTRSRKTDRAKCHSTLANILASPPGSSETDVYDRKTTDGNRGGGERVRGSERERVRERDIERRKRRNAERIQVGRTLSRTPPDRGAGCSCGCIIHDGVSRWRYYIVIIIIVVFVVIIHAESSGHVNAAAAFWRDGVWSASRPEEWEGGRPTVELINACYSL